MEVLICVVLMGFITAVVAAAITVIFRSEQGIFARTAESHDTRQIVSFLPLDVESGPSKADAYKALSGGAPGDRGSGCADLGNENVLRIDVTDRRLDLVDKRIAYRLVTAANHARLDRYECSFDTATSTWVTNTVNNIADYLDPGGSPIVESIVRVSNPAELDPALQLVSEVELRYVQRGDIESIVAAPREERPLENEGTCSQDPLAAAQNMAVFFERDVTLNRTEVKGALYVGGTLTFEDSSIAQADPPAPNAPVPADTGLLAGAINWAGSTGTLDVKPHRGIIIEDVNNFSRNGQTVTAPDGSPSPQIVAGSAASITAGSGAPVVSPIDAFTSLRSCSDRLAGLPDTCNNGACAAHVVPTGAAPNYRFTLTDGKANALNIDEATLLSIQSGSINFTTGDKPTADRPLIINVSSEPGSTISFEPPNLQGQGEVSDFVLWNFPNASHVVLQSGDVLWGTLLAPYADVVSDTGVEGGVIAKSFVINYSTLHDVRYFQGTLDW